MGSNWHVKRERPSITELLKNVADLTKAATDALKEHGEYSREYRNADYLLRNEQRKLDRATYEEKRRDELNKLTPSEIVDKVMER